MKVLGEGSMIKHFGRIMVISFVELIEKTKRED